MSATQFAPDTRLTSSWRELASRENDGLEISLHWNKSDDRIKVTVADVRRNEEFELDVPGANALEAFHHPFAFATGRGLCFGVSRCEPTDLQLQS